MIASLRGRVARKGDGRAIIEANGVGYLVHLPAGTESQLPAAGEEAYLHVYTQVRDDAIVLFGFSSTVELQLFEHLISVNGIGPKLALAALSGLSAQHLASAIRQGDVRKLSGISGVGKKTAERIVLDLRDKMDAIEFPTDATSTPTLVTSERADAISALLNLGYRRRDAELAVEHAATTAVGGIEPLIKAALAQLIRRTS